MRIDQIDLKIVRLPLVRPFQTSSSRKEHLDHILVRVVADGAIGWGECASPSDPYYCPETTETCWHILKDFLAPLVLGRDWSNIDELVHLYRLVKGNKFAQSGLEMACWDALARSQGQPLRSLLGGTRGRDSLGREPGDRETDRAAPRSNRALPGGRLPPDQAENRAGMGCRRSCGGCASDFPRSPCRSTPTRRIRSMTCPRSRRSTTSTSS